jgi:probable F420-dependent oxidoreductase
VILPQRQTALVAKQAAQVDLLCGGRLRLGIGIGWNAVEYEGLNEDFKTRGARSEEQIALLRALWTEPIVTFKGRWDTITEAGINPLPVQRPIPIWIGGDAPPVLARVGRLADGWLPQTPPDEATAAQIRQIRAAAVEAGRDPASIGIEPRLTIKRTPQALWPEFIRGWQALGATHLSINTMGLGFTSVDQHIQALRDGWDAIHGILGYAAPQG